MKKLLMFGVCLLFAVALTACGSGVEQTKSGSATQQESMETKEPGMYFLGKFTPWENLETTGVFRVEDGILSADVYGELEEKVHSDRIGGTIVLPEGITTIEKYVFAGCHNIDRIIIPETVRDIGMRAFSKCTQLQELVIPDSVTRIGRSAFDGVKNVSYQGKLVYTPDDVYWGADSLNQKGNTKGETFEAESDGVRYTYQKFDRQENAIVITKIENAGRNLVIPAKLNGFDVYCVGSGDIVLFGYNDKVKKKPVGDNSYPVLDSVTMEDGIKGVSSSAFQRIYIKQLTLPPSLEFINEAAFEENIFLEKLDIKSSKAYIGENAFAGTGLKELQLPVMEDMENQMDSMAFWGNARLKKVTFAKGTREICISSECFEDCPDVQIIIGRGVKTFSSDINTNSGKVRVLDKGTEIVFPKMVKAKEGTRRGNYVEVAETEGEKFRYRASFREYIVPEGFEPMEMLKNAYYVLPVEEEEHMEGTSKEFYHRDLPLRKIKYRIEK